MQADEIFALILKWGPIIITVASALAALTPTPADDSAIRVIAKVVDALALNVKHAKRAPAAKSATVTDAQDTPTDEPRF